MGDKVYHRLLMRQMRRFMKPELIEELTPFLESISAFYEDVDKERRMLERTLDVSSKELEEANSSLREQNKELRAQEELRTSRDEAIIAMNQAQEANKAKDAFLSSMSHELRTPLNAIIGFSQVLMAKPDTPDSVKIFVDKINLAGKNLLSLVNTILDFSKIEAGKMEVHKTLFSMNDLMKEITVLTEPMAEKKRLTCIAVMDKEIEIYADRQLIKQVLINLITNAIKFSPEGESIVLEYTHEDQRELFSLCDHGHGIPKAKFEMLFDPFTQIREHQNDAIKGTGLGLAIVKKIIELHEGEIWVESVVGEGSCFNFTLPLQR
ncbi:ATP-binding protein [Sulfuricurvum sp.]|uniref:sensor histidine kinase n=1 Tax=Sulfuricurvum sp. TaxID=2025608 RepID=UPI0026025475|nr:ATP-binding protein [Sulfuricurvum sp.]MDD2782064.1 ATP-binding protein [Sulfuricurvum sp.]